MIYIQIKIIVIENQLKKCFSSYFIRLYERQNCPESDLYGSTQVRARFVGLGVRYVHSTGSE